MVMEKAMAAPSSTLAWQIPWTEEPARLQSMGLLRVRHDWAASLSLFTSMHWRRKWHPTPVFLPGKSHGQRSLAGYSPWGRKESDTSYQLSNSTNLKTMVLSVLACFILFRDLLRLARPVSHVQLCPSISGGLLPGLPPPISIERWIDSVDSMDRLVSSTSPGPEVV